METFNSVYILIDPRDYTIRYVGQTNNIKIRYNSHICDINSNTHKSKWIKSLKAFGFRPKVMVIGEYTKDTIDVWEIFWINYYRQCGCKLTNYGDGGKARKGYKWSETTRQKFVKSMTGRKLSEDTKLKISAKHKGKIISDNTKVKMRNNNLGKTLSYDHKRKIGESNKGKKRSDSVIIHMRNCRPNKLKIDQYTLSGIFVKTWESISDADRELNIPNPNIVKCLKGVRKSAGGFVWKYHIINSGEV